MLDILLIDEQVKESARKKKDKSDIRQRDLELYNDWVSSGKSPDKLRPILSQFRGVIRKEANSWANHTDLPPAAVHAEFKKQFVSQLHKYDPSKGVLISTWATHGLRKARREMTKYQNPVRITEGLVYKTGDYDRALATLDDMLGREPTTREISEHLGWTDSEVKRMRQQKRETGFSSVYEGGYDPTTITPSRESEILRFIQYELNPEELLVFEYRSGAHGKPELRPGEIAKKLKMNPSKVSRILGSIAKKMEKHM